MLLLLAGSVHAASILVLGDSLSAGHGLAAGQGWVDLLAQRVAQCRPPYSVVNASISGETSAGGLARLGASLEQARPALLVLELGANDGLRGLSLKALRDNLDAMVSMARKHDAKVLLIGMRLPPNYGAKYTEAFQQIYTDLAKRRKLPLVPFLLEKVALDPSLMQPDRLHPTAAAQPLLLDTVWPRLAPLMGCR